MSNNRFRKEARLLTAADFKGVFDRADAKASHKYLLLLAHSNNLDHNRLGLVIAKKHVRLAVQRNRIKRVTREFFRQAPETARHFDVVVLARKGMDQLDNATLSTILQQQWRKLTKAETR